MSWEYSEDSLIEQPAIEIFESLGYSHFNCYHETFGENSTIDRETSYDVVLISKLKPAFTQIDEWGGACLDLVEPRRGGVTCYISTSYGNIQN